MRSYTLDNEAARQANANSYIDQTGKYIGEITMAKAVTSTQGTEGIEFSFKDKDGQQANYLTVWTFNSSGEKLYGYKVLNAMMTVAGIQRLEQKPETIKDKDGNPTQILGFPAFYGKPIGLVLQKEFYKKNDGSEGSKFNIHAPFHASSELTAKEIIEGAVQPRALAGIIASLKDKPAPAKPQNRSSQPQNNYQAAKNGSMHDDPFGDSLGEGY